MTRGTHGMSLTQASRPARTFVVGNATVTGGDPFEPTEVGFAAVPICTGNDEIVLEYQPACSSGRALISELCVAILVGILAVLGVQAYRQLRVYQR
jgi:hypothetical protein